MNDLVRISYALAIGAVTVLLAGCGGSQPPVTARGVDSSLLSKPLGAYSSLYSFQDKPDGENPEARLIPFSGALYGVTSVGGAKCGKKGCGTIFKITTTGSETVIHRFKGVPDGAEPLTELTAVKRELYGTTYLGGMHCTFRKIDGCGAVFAIDASGVERVLYRFNGVPDGADPEGPLTLVGRTLYGTTTSGGIKCPDDPGGCGTVYSIGTSGKVRILYRFAGKPDGANPTGNLVFLDGTLYGTTVSGGSYNRGAVFAIKPSGTEHVLYSATLFFDMASPSGLVAMGGLLYGSSIEGGKRGGGTVYAVTTSGKEHIVHGFSQDKARNGDRALGRLIAVNGLLYGTTRDGGQEHSGYGLVYSLSASGDLRVLYRFAGPPDGAAPYAGVSDAKGTLYGTTIGGGTGCYHYGCQGGYGTVFRITR